MWYDQLFKLQVCSLRKFAKFLRMSCTYAGFPRAPWPPPIVAFLCKRTYHISREVGKWRAISQVARHLTSGASSHNVRVTWSSFPFLGTHSIVVQSPGKIKLAQTIQAPSSPSGRPNCWIWCVLIQLSADPTLAGASCHSYILQSTEQ